MSGAARRSRTAGNPLPPRINPVLESGFLLEMDGLHRRLDYDGTDLSGVDIETVEIEECRFDRANLAESRLQRVVFTDVVMERCDLANLRADSSSLLRTKVSGSRLTGFSWTNGVIRDVMFDDCRMNLAGFRFTKLKAVVVFKDCDLSRANFQNADLSGVRFTGCDLTGAQFSNATMTGTRIENCTLVDIVGVTSFGGAIIKSGDAMTLAYSLANALGITIEE